MCAVSWRATPIRAVRSSPIWAPFILHSITVACCKQRDLRDMGARLHAMISRLMPDLADVRLNRVWKGQCAGTFDFMPHIGRHDGLWYALGYNFAGVPMGSYLGLKLAEQILGKAEGATVFGTTPFPTLPFYGGNPWFVPLAMRWFDWKDARLARKGA